MEYEELMKSTLIDLRSVTQSCKGGVALSNLQNDYRNLIGKTIPYNSLGFNSLVDFIQSIPDVIKLKRNSNGVLFVEAVSDDSTSHLANLIAKQKGPSSKKNSKSSYVSKKYGFHRQNNANKLKSTTSSSCSSTTSEVLNVKNQEIDDLKLALEKEKEKNRNLLSQVSHLQSVIKENQDSLVAVQETAKNIVLAKTKNQLPDKTSSLLMEIEDLKSKFKVEENKNNSLSSEIIELNSLVQIGQEKLSAEQKLVQRLQSQLEDLKTKMLLKYYASNEIKWDESLETQKKGESLSCHNNLLKTNLLKSNTLIQDIDQNSLISQLGFVSMYKEQCLQVNDLKNQVKQDHEHMTTLRKEFEQQQLQIHTLNAQMKTLSSATPKFEVDMNLAMQMLEKHLECSSQNGQLFSNASALSNNSHSGSGKNHPSVDLESMISKIHDLFPKIKKEHIAVILGFHAYDEIKAILAINKDGGLEALKSAEVKNKISRIHRKFPNIGIERIPFVLEFYDDDECKAIDALSKDSGREALSFLSEPKKFRKKILRLHKSIPNASIESIKVVLQFYNKNEKQAIDAFHKDGGLEALNHASEKARLKNVPVQVISEVPCVSVKDCSKIMNWRER